MDAAVNQSLALISSAGQSLISGSSLTGKTSTFAERDGFNMMDSQYENGLFSSSLSELLSKKSRIPSDTEVYGHSVDTTISHTEEEQLFTTQEIEEEALRNLLPDDDDLLSGVADGLDFAMQTTGNDLEELDFFSSVGGMDLEDEDSSIKNPAISNKSTSCGYPWGEHPSRTLLVRNVNSKIEDSELRALFEIYGDICTFYTSRKNCGSFIVSYYDIRAAQIAMESLQIRPPRGWKLDVHYSMPEKQDIVLEKDINQGMLLVSNLDSSVSNEELHRTFGTFGSIKEIRNSHHGTQQKFVEFYDIRAAKEALHVLDGTDIAGRQIIVEPSCLGGLNRLAQGWGSPSLRRDIPIINSPSGFHGPVRLEPASNMVNVAFGKQSVIQSQVLEPTFDHGTSSSVPNGLLLRGESNGIPSCHTYSGPFLSRVKFDLSPNFHSCSLPDYQGGLSSGFSCNSISNGGVVINEEPVEIVSRRFSSVGTNRTSLKLNGDVFASSGCGRNSIPANQCMWASHYPQHPVMIWPTSLPTVNGTSFAPPQVGPYGLPVSPSHLLSNIVPRPYHNVGSSLAASGFHPGSLGSVTYSREPVRSMDLLPHNPVPKLVGLQFPNQKCAMFPGRGQMVPVLSSFDPPSDHNRTCRTEGASNLTSNRKQYELDTDRIIRGEDKRTTLMIKNIPNKYTSKMLLAAIDEQHRGTYDFIYLPIDFKNKCNVGYAFINMVDASQIIPFYKAFNGKRWEKFNSEKVASLAYARIQGKAALIAHFQNSSLMSEDKRCRPILFNTDGPNAGDQVPFPVGVNVRSRKTRSNTLVEIHQGAPPSSDTGDNSNGDLFMNSGKDSVL